MHTQTLPPNRLRELREDAGLKLYDIAAKIRRDTSVISRYEQGTTAVPDGIKFELAALYGVTVEHLMGWDREAA